MEQPLTSPDAQRFRERMRKDADLVRAATTTPPIDPGSTEPNEDWPIVRLERGDVYFAALLDGSPAAVLTIIRRLEPVIAATNAPGPGRSRVIDRAGHARASYRGVLVYSWLQSYRLLYEALSRDAFGRWDEALRPWCDALEAELTDTAWPDAPMPASQGAEAAAAVWAALALHVAGKVFVRDAWTDLAADTFGRAARNQTPAGAFLHAGPADSPELHWFHELVLLHAAASYAVQAEDRGIASAVKRATEYHLAETQPDHATNQPWALFAFLWNDRTRSLGESLLHTSRVQYPAGAEGLSLMLLTDALYCLRLFA